MGYYLCNRGHAGNAAQMETAAAAREGPAGVEGHATGSVRKFDRSEQAFVTPNPKKHGGR